LRFNITVPATLALAALIIGGCNPSKPSKDAPDTVVDTSRLVTGPASPQFNAADDAMAPAARVADTLQPETPTPTSPAGNIYTPASGTAERKALMDALRAKVDSELGGQAEFVVKTLRSNGQWAFAEVEPQWPGGRRINPANTPLYRGDPDWPFDGLHTEAIWRKVDGRWTVFAHSIGSTDVWWTEHCNTVPRGIMTGC